MPKAKAEPIDWPPLRTHDGKPMKVGATVWRISAKPWDAEGPIPMSVVRVDPERRYAVLRQSHADERVWSPVKGARAPVHKHAMLHFVELYSTEKSARATLRRRLNQQIKSHNETIRRSRDVIENARKDIRRINRRLAGWLVRYG